MPKLKLWVDGKKTDTLTEINSHTKWSDLKVHREIEYFADESWDEGDSNFVVCSHAGKEKDKKWEVSVAYVSPVFNIVMKD